MPALTNFFARLQRQAGDLALFSVAIFFASAFGDEVAERDSLAKQIQQTQPAIESAQVVFLRYAAGGGAPGQPTPVQEVPPIDPSSHKGQIVLGVYSKSGKEEALELLTFLGNAVISENRFEFDGEKGYDLIRATGVMPGGSATLLGRRPAGFDQMDAILLWGNQNLVTENLLDILNQPNSKIVHSTSDSEKGAVTVLTGKREKPKMMPGRKIAWPAGDYEFIMDASKGNTLVKRRLSADGKPLDVLKWSNYVEVEKGLWFPLEYESNVFDEKGKVIVRNKTYVVSVSVNGHIPRQFWGQPLPIGTRVTDTMKNNEVYTVTEKPKAVGR